MILWHKDLAGAIRILQQNSNHWTIERRVPTIRPQPDFLLHLKPVKIGLRPISREDIILGVMKRKPSGCR